MRKVTAAALGLGLAGIIAAGMAVERHEEPASASPPPAPPVPVVTAPVKQGDVPIVIRGLGTVVPFNVATIRSQVEGYLDSVDFVEGQTVKHGDVLAQVDPRIYQARLDEARASSRPTRPSPPTCRPTSAATSRC